MVVELVPALLLLIVMHPVANRTAPPKFSMEFASMTMLGSNNTEELVIASNRLRTVTTTYGEPLLAANDPKTRI